jgi:hypothetical protein
MASISESGHAINIANFETIVVDATSYGATYNPSKTTLKIPAVTTLLTTSKTTHAGVLSAESLLNLAKDARKVAFKSLSPLLTKIINALKATDTTEQVNETAKTIIRKLQGRRATPKKTEEQKKVAASAGNAIVEISSSQMGFDNRIDNFDKLIKLLSSVTLYAPNEADLKVTALTTTLNDLKAKNLAVTNAEVAVNNARIIRFDAMYKVKSGLIDIALDIKAYIKSVFGATSPQYKKISALKFSRPR